MLVLSPLRDGGYDLPSQKGLPWDLPGGPVAKTPCS